MNVPPNLQEELQRLSVLSQSGRYDEMASAASRAITKFPNIAPFHFFLGLACQMQKKFAAALRSYQRAVALWPQYVEAALNLGVVMETMGDGPGAIAQYRKVIALAPTHGAANRALGMALVAGGQFDEAAKQLTAALKILPQDIYITAYLASAERARGKPFADLLQAILKNQGADFFTVIVKVWAALALDRPDLAYSFKLPNLNIPDYGAQGAFYRSPKLREQLGALPKLSGTLPHQNARPLLYAGADGVYAEQFARQLIESALKHTPGCDFHIHLMNPGSFNPDAAFKSFPKDRVTWTIEEMQPATKIFYAPRRWVRLAQILQAVERTAILIDADCAVRGDILAAIPADFDVLVYDRPTDVFAHQMVNAGFFAVKPKGRDFLDFLASYILHFELAGKLKWFDDQFDIVVAREWFKRNVPDVVIKAAPPHMMSWSEASRDECLIWHAKGDLKAKD